MINTRAYPSYTKKLCAHLNAYYLLYIGILGIFSFWINWHHINQSYFVWHDLDFEKTFASFFDKTVIAEMPTPTFPMWGYGLILWLIRSKYLILLIQNLLAFYVLYAFVNFIKKIPLLKKDFLCLFLMLTIVSSLSFHPLHAFLWPKGIALCFFTLSFIFLIQAIHLKKLSQAIWSGFLFGLMLNFRSDYYLLPIIYCIVILLIKKRQYNVIKIITVWFFVTYSMLIPWALYTKKACNHFLLTSTNSGLILCLGLGDLPNNKWNITHSDGDPVIKNLLKEKFGYVKGYSSCRYEEDMFLKKTFLSWICKDPLEYIRKCFYVFWLVCDHGFFPGFFFKNNLSSSTHIKEQFKTSPFRYALKNPSKTIRIFGLWYTSRCSNQIVTLSLLFFLLSLFYALYTSSLVMILILTSIAYQTALNVFCVHMSIYTSNMILFHLVNVTYGIVCFKNFMPILIRKLYGIFYT